MNISADSPRRKCFPPPISSLQCSGSFVFRNLLVNHPLPEVMPPSLAWRRMRRPTKAAPVCCALRGFPLGHVRAQRQPLSVARKEARTPPWLRQLGCVRVRFKDKVVYPSETPDSMNRRRQIRLCFQCDLIRQFQGTVRDTIMPALFPLLLTSPLRTYSCDGSH